MEKRPKESYVEFLYELHTNNVELTQDKIDLLIKHGYIKVDAQQQKIAEDLYTQPEVNRSILQKISDISSKIDEYVDIFSDQEEQEIPVYTGGIEISAKDWLPKSKTDHEKDFIEWITSMNERGFKNKTEYKKFNLYVQQATQWLSESMSYSDITNEEEIEEYQIEELRRCDENTLYFMNKYLLLKEGDMTSGARQYKATKGHEVICYLFDCGYSFGLAKPRQIAATSTLGGCALKKVVFTRNFFLKFITEDKDKGIEIFDDKIRYPFSELPTFMRPEVKNYRDNMFQLGSSEEKGDKDGVNSKILVTAPKKTAVAGGSPQLVMIDEAGNIGILTQMLENARPTMFWMNPHTGKFEMKRQVIFWGTGGEMEKGGKAFETEFMSIWTKWKEGDYSSGIVPVFLDWTTRPGITQADYDREKKVFYSKVGPNHQQSIIEFHQQYPSSIQDVFRSSGKTLVDDSYLEEQLDRIYKAKKDTRFQLIKTGYFEPVYDYESPTDENSDVPFKIIGANFIPTEDIDHRATVTIFADPDTKWKNRYFQGTDPIASDTGLSNMASVIWDKHHKTIAAILDFRTRDYRYVFLQVTLLGIYYKTNNQDVKELVESNIGQSYTQYKEQKGYGNSLTLNYELPPYLQNKTAINEGIGIDNRGLRNQAIINKMHELIVSYGDRIYFPDFFMQLKTFVCEVSDRGKEMWGPSNRKYFRDDILFAATFSYICAELCYPELVPENIEDRKKKIALDYSLKYDENWNLVRVPTRKILNG